MDEDYGNLTQEDISQIMSFLDQPIDGEVDTSQFLNDGMLDFFGSSAPSSNGFFPTSVPVQQQQSYQMEPLLQQQQGGMAPLSFSSASMPQGFAPFSQGNSFGSAPPLFFQQSNEMQQEPLKIPTTLQFTPSSHSSLGDIKSEGSLGDPSSQLLGRLQSMYVSQQAQLQKIRQTQRQVLQNPQKESFDDLNSQHEQLKRQLDFETKSLSDLLAAMIMSPAEIRRASQVQMELQSQVMQLELYHQELQQLLLQRGMPTRCFVALTIVEQCFPTIITKQKTMEEPLVVQLMTGASVNLQSVSPVKVTVNMEGPQVKGSTSKNVETDEEKLDEFQHTAKFHLKFLNGTRKAPATLTFAVQVQLAGMSPITLESNPSNPFVVITNECQYEEAGRMLLKMDCFGLQGERAASWSYLANKLQRFFLHGTRQDPIKPQRYLTKQELMYLNSKCFGGQQMIPVKVFEEFWAWFGKGLQKLRYQRHLCSMWQSGLIYGFISREGVNAALVNQEPGTFLIRLSERHPGTFAVGYTIDEFDPEKRVRHYLIRPEDVYGARKTLPDFLMENPQFSKFLVIHDFVSGSPKHRIVDKELVLEQYGAKHVTPDIPPNGYDNSLVGKAGN